MVWSLVVANIVGHIVRQGEYKRLVVTDTVGYVEQVHRPTGSDRGMHDNYPHRAKTAKWRRIPHSETPNRNGICFYRLH